jgi:pimeloyl-ACP methyl ester carboxylesterase
MACVLEGWWTARAMFTHTSRLCALALCVAVFGAGSPAAGATSATGVACDSRSVQVGAGLQISGTYCRPTDGSATSAIVMVAGGGYNKAYWDFPYEPGTYSFARAAARAGYAAFAVDRLGTGDSSKPPSATVTSIGQADAMHKVIEHLRDSGLGEGPFADVFLAGHSLGSLVTVIEAATFDDVDGVVITGATHRINALKVTELFVFDLHPAPLDPALADRGLDVGYLATKPGHRYSAVHRPGDVDPAVVQADEATKDVFSVTEAADGVGFGSAVPYSVLIDAPVLLAVGQLDEFFCRLISNCTSRAALLAQERPQYANSPCVDAVVMPAAGHSINLHPSAPELQDHVIGWLDAVVAGGCPDGP